VHVDYANALVAAGHEVTIVYPTWPYRFHHRCRDQFAEWRHNIGTDAGIAWCSTDARVSRVPAIQTRFLPDADAVVAVSWPTVRDVGRLHGSRGRKVHSVMHHESGTGPEEKIRDVYRVPCYRITYAHAVAQQLREAFECEVDAIVPHGINPRVFYREPIGRQTATVLMLYHPDPRKGAADGLEALELLHRRMPDVQFDLCGTVTPPPLPSWIRFTFHPSDAELRRLYNTSTALLYPSRVEGFGLPPLEAMACGCPVVTTAVGAVPEFASDGGDAFIVAPGDSVAMADRLAMLVDDEGLRARLSAEGLKTAARYAIGQVTPMFEAALAEAARR
jgi:glycosyltransferase involved in cell wall biosynthesis